MIQYTGIYKAMFDKGWREINGSWANPDEVNSINGGHTMTTGDKAKLISAESQAALKEYKTWKYFQEKADKAIEAYERLMCLVPKEDVAIMVELTSGEGE